MTKKVKVVKYLPNQQVPYTPPSDDDIADVVFNVPFNSQSIAKTRAYGAAIACMMVHNKKEGKRTVIRFIGVRGAGKSALITAIMKHLSKAHDVTDFGTISFIGVKEYTIGVDNLVIKIAHIDPDIKGDQRLITMHSKDWDVLLFEHGRDKAFKDHNNAIIEMGDKVIDFTVEISQDKDQRTFTMSSASGKPVDTPPYCTWKGRLIEKRFTPSRQLTGKQARQLRKKFKTKKAVILTIESSCDDTCIVLKYGNKVIYLMQKQCMQEGQKTGLSGVDPFVTSAKHAENFAIAMAEIKAILKEHNLTIDLVSVTQGPGQAFALLEGVHFAQKVANELGVPIMYLDHIKGHAISPLLPPPEKVLKPCCANVDPLVAAMDEIRTVFNMGNQGADAQGPSEATSPLPEEIPEYPYLVFVVSGGHTVLLLVESPVDMRIVYTTPDDAIGEVIDKVCRAMGISAIPAGPECEKWMNQFLGGKKLWIKVTGKSGNDVIDGMTSDPKERETLKAFRDLLKEMDPCTTPAEIKRMMCMKIMQQKFHDCDKGALLRAYIKACHPTTSPTIIADIKTMCKTFMGTWSNKTDGTPEKVIEHVKCEQASGIAGVYDTLASEYQQNRLLQVLEEILSRSHEVISDPRAFLHAFLNHFDMMDVVTVENIDCFCNAFDEKQRPQGNATEIIEWMKHTEPEEYYVKLMVPYVMTSPSFSDYIKLFGHNTSLTPEQKQFYCACLHLVSYSYLYRHLRVAIAKFPHVKYISIGGGVACNVFLKAMLKVMLERNGLTFTAVDKAWCSDNAIMMWKLTVDTLSYLFACEEECTCCEDMQSDSEEDGRSCSEEDSQSYGEESCQSCERLRQALLQHGCGTFDEPIDKGNVLVRPDDRWDNEATHRMFVRVPIAPTASSVSTIKHVPDDYMTVHKMWEYIANCKNGSEGSIRHTVNTDILPQWHDKMYDDIRRWKGENKGMHEHLLVTPHHYDAIMVLLMTNFFGRGFAAFVGEKPKTDSKSYDPLPDIKTVREFLRQILGDCSFPN